MSCNGCRVLRKGCSEDCMLRQSLQWIESAQAQANATVFVAKFFGRAGLMSFISAVPYDQRPSLFRSLLFEAVGRAINPVSGAVGLLWTGNWHMCQAAVTTVFHGGTIEPLQEFDGGILFCLESDNASDCGNFRPGNNLVSNSSKVAMERNKFNDHQVRTRFGSFDLNLCLMRQTEEHNSRAVASLEESETTTFGSETFSGSDDGNGSDLHEGERKLLRLFV